MNLSNIFSLPTLICLGITLLLIGAVAMFFLQRLNEQNLKIRHMVGLVSTFADELKLINQRIHGINENMVILSKGEMQIDSILLKPPSLIEVSDDDASENSVEEDDDESNSDSNTESASELESESDSDSDTDSETENVDIKSLNNEVNTSTIKTINMGETLDIKLKSETIEYASSTSVISVSDVENDDEEEDKNENDDDDEISILNEESLIITSVNTLTSVDAFDGRVSNFLSNSDELIKSIDISTLDDNNIVSESSDYKKMSINKLKSIAIAKGLIADSSKLKKNELLKLLEVQ
jgi:hypothetical protein